MKKTMKRILSFALVSAMIMSMAVTAFASDENITGQIFVGPGENDYICYGIDYSLNVAGVGMPSYDIVTANIPAEIEGVPVEMIVSQGFLMRVSLENVTLPDTLVNINELAFNCCFSLTEITIPDSVEFIGEAAFRGCSSLTSIILPDSVTYIGVDAFDAIDNLTIYCNPGSFAESYAVENGLSYAALEDAPVITETTEAVSTEPVVATGTAVATSSTVLVDGEEVAFEAYNIADNNYFKLRDIAQILSGTNAQFEVTWDGEKQSINMVTGEAYTTVGGELATGDGAAKEYVANTSTIYLNGEEVSLTAYTINNNNYFKLRDLGEAIGFNVTWDNDANSIVIASDEAYTAD